LKEGQFDSDESEKDEFIIPIANHNILDLDG